MPSSNCSHGTVLSALGSCVLRWSAERLAVILPCALSFAVLNGLRECLPPACFCLWSLRTTERTCEKPGWRDSLDRLSHSSCTKNGKKGRTCTVDFQFHSLHIDNTLIFLPPAYEILWTQGNAFHIYKGTLHAIENICSALGLVVFYQRFECVMVISHALVVDPWNKNFFMVHVHTTLV